MIILGVQCVGGYFPARKKLLVIQIGCLNVPIVPMCKVKTHKFRACNVKNLRRRILRRVVQQICHGQEPPVTDGINGSFNGIGGMARHGQRKTNSNSKGAEFESF
jgi:hypothetical protein